jgi:hypothetical protein
MHTGEKHFILWPTEAIENQAAEIHRLRDIIDRAGAALDRVTPASLSRAREVLAEGKGQGKGAGRG